MSRMRPGMRFLRSAAASISLAAAVIMSPAMAIAVAPGSPTGSDLSLTYVRSHTDRPGIYLAREDGSGARRIGDGSPAGWSPDGRTLAIVAPLKGSETYSESHSQLSLLDLASGRLEGVDLSRFWEKYGSPVTVAWSPDGTQLAVVLMGWPNGTTDLPSRVGLLITDRSGASARFLAADGWLSEIRWTKDGLYLLSVSDGGGGDLRLVDPGTGTTTRLGTLIGGDNPVSMSLSADGGTIAYLSTDLTDPTIRTNDKVVVKDVASGRTIARFPAGGDALMSRIALSPTGSMIAEVSAGSGGYFTTIVSAENGRQLAMLGDAGEPAWRAAQSKTPVLLVHGVTSSKDAFKSWTGALAEVSSNDQGFKLFRGSSSVFGDGVPVFVLDYSGKDEASGDIPSTSDAIPWAIGEAKRATSTTEVVVIAHSMGGLLGRHYLEGLLPNLYAGDVSAFVTLDTPNMGCALSDMWLTDIISRWKTGWTDSRAGQEMDPGSAVLAKLNSTDLPATGTAYTVVVGNHYPLIGDGLLTAREQIPFMNDTSRLTRLGDCTIECIDAVHSEQINSPDYQTLFKLGRLDKGAPARPGTPVLASDPAKVLAKQAYQTATD